MSPILRSILLGLALVWTAAAHAQQSPPPPQQPELPSAVPMPEQVVANPQAPCVQPPPVVSWQDYEGPFRKVVGAFGRKLERKSVHAPHYKPGAILCSLTLGGKFALFAQDTLDPITFLSAGFNAGMDQAENSEPRFGQGAEGYGKRFGYNFSGQASSEFFSDVMYATIFREDPRYYRLAHGAAGRRLIHAIEHTVVAKREDGANEFNFCEWLGTTSTVAVSRAYHTGAEPGVGPAAKSVGLAVAQGVGWNILREFWPELAHTFKLPFRGESEPRETSLAPAGKF